MTAVATAPGVLDRLPHPVRSPVLGQHCAELGEVVRACRKARPGLGLPAQAGRKDGRVIFDGARLCNSSVLLESAAAE